MKLNPALAEVKTYRSIGTINNIEIDDLRSPLEFEKGITAKNSISPQIWSGDTNPEVKVYLENLITNYIQKSNVLTFNKNGDFYIKVKINSLKVERSVTIYRYLTLALLDFPVIVANVDLTVEIKKGKNSYPPINIHNTEKLSYWAYTETGWQQVSDQAKELLEKAVNSSMTSLLDQLASLEFHSKQK